jgi:hypothetical protein
MKRIVMLVILLMMVVSLGGCWWGFEGRGRDGDRDDRGRGHDNRGEMLDRGGVHEGERGEKPERRRSETEKVRQEQCVVIRG